MTDKKGKVLNPFQHALKRPDTYIGSTITTKSKQWVCASNDDEPDPLDPKIVSRKIKYNQGLLRIFIEPMSNGIDNKWRSEKNDIKMKRIDFKVDNDPESETYGWITVRNDGYCIPAEKTKYEFEDYRTGKTRKEKLYPVEVFFGEMLAGTNFEDEDDKKTSGRNGMGAKTTVVFSKHVKVEHTNPDQKKKIIIEFSDNGKKRSEPKVTSYKAKTGYTEISFLPDDDDLFNLIKKHIYECAMITGLIVTLNGEKIIIKNLEKYVRLYFPNPKENALMYFKAPNGDECVIIERGVPDMDAKDEVPQVSWINGLNTRDGGTHVKPWVKAIFKPLVKTFNSIKRKKGEIPLKTTEKELYPYFTIFVRAEASGAKFGGQTKDVLVAPDIELAADNKEKKVLVTDISNGIKKMLKWNFITLLEEKLSLKAEKTQSRKDNAVSRKVAASKKYTPANFAGTKKGHLCTLIISEGLSAKTFADRMFSNDYYGSYAIRGKFINVQNASIKEINENPEVQALKKIVGLVTGVDYTDPANRKTLKYGKILIITDQDDDGFHIRGLLLNFLHHLWESLFEIVLDDGTSFVESLTTAVAMVREGKNITMFFSNPEFQEWMTKQDPKKLKKMAKTGNIKYYKGLGSHEPSDVKLYTNDEKRIRYVLDGEESDYMDLGFNKKQSHWRKEWITRDIPKPGELVISEDQDLVPVLTKGDLSLSSFVDSQLIIYHIMALRRALPNMYDGFKESQRKAFYGVLMDKDARHKPVNLENLSGSVKKLTGYHHAGTALQDTMKKMAQGFVYSNNIPPLRNAGEVGTRVHGGADASAARYVSTTLEEVTWTIFPTLDEPILKHAMEDGESIEFEQFMPIIPMILINGANGIASGYSTNIPCYNPDDIVEWIEAWLYSEDGNVDLPWLKPWYRGFKGEIELLKHVGAGKSRKVVNFDPEEHDFPTGWRSKGILEQGKKGWWHIKELPLGMWTSTMTEYLEYLLSGTPPEGSKKKKGDKYLKDVRWKGTTNTIHWDILPTKEFIPDMNVVGNFKNLQNTFSLTNMHVLDSNGYPRNYSSAEELLQDFCKERLRYYELRKKYWLTKYKQDYQKESDRYKYVKAVVDKKLNKHQKDDALEADMKKLGLRKVVGGADEGKEDSKATYNYLLSMQMRSMTVKRLEEIKKEMISLKKKVDELEEKSESDLWLEDLAIFKTAYKKFLKTRKEE